MPETPDFEQIARHIGDLFGAFANPPSSSPTQDVAEQLRLVWNARGAADVAKLEIVVRAGEEFPLMRDMDRALRSLDR